jgi:hypothetical protein
MKNQYNKCEVYLLTLQNCQGCNEKKIEQKRKPKECCNTNPIPIFFSKQTSFLEKGLSNSWLTRVDYRLYQTNNKDIKLISTSENLNLTMVYIYICYVWGELN